MAYLKQREKEKSSKKAEARTANYSSLEQEELQGVYRRLWDDVEIKSKKFKELQRHFLEARKLEWLKLLTSNNLSSKNKEIQR